LDHLGVTLAPEAVKAKFSSRAMNPEESHTYVKGGKGSIGGWQKYFKDSHKQAFKRVAGDLLIDLGYETNLDW
ncbi:MAG TPA: sulfotransferase, partial [Nodosilinea sp.]|nr:sulfotransferase [Nodosilinea sp.]